LVRCFKAGEGGDITDRVLVEDKVFEMGELSEVGDVGNGEDV